MTCPFERRGDGLEVRQDCNAEVSFAGVEISGEIDAGANWLTDDVLSVVQRVFRFLLALNDAEISAKSMANLVDRPYPDARFRKRPRLVAPENLRVGSVPGVVAADGGDTL
jgi:hypothetical protein